MSREPSQPANDEQPAATTPVSATEYPAEPASTYQAPGTTTYQDAGTAPFAHPGTSPDQPQPTFTPAGPTSAADEPLLSNTTGMRASWQKVQAEFVDDPQAAVMDAADLIERTAQSLVEALRQRQRQLRVLSDGDASGDPTATGGTGTAGTGTGSPASSGAPDTEHLRLMMRRYRTLFDQLCSA